MLDRQESVGNRLSQKDNYWILILPLKMKLISKNQDKIKDKNVLLRIDADVPIKNGQVIDDSRLSASLPTIKYLLENGANLTIIGHLDRPAGKEVPELKMRPVEDKLIELIGTHDRWQILENLRFNPGEEENDPEFSRQLASGQDIFVQDAFAVCHRAHSSTVGITKFLPSLAGLSVEREMKNLNNFLHNSSKPIVAIIGGAKIEDKKPVINAFLDQVEQVLVGGKVANELQKEKDKLSKKIILPIDGNPNILGFDIGPKTIDLFSNIIASAKTIFWAGPIGKCGDPRYSEGTRKIAQAIIDSKAVKYAGGGDTSAYIYQNKIADKFDYISTGGGAALDYLVGKKLPGLEALE